MVRVRTPDGAIRWQVLAGWMQRLGDALTSRPEDWRHQPSVSVVKDGPHRTVYRFDLPAGAVYLKHNRCRGPAAALRRLFRASTARREYGRSLEIARRGVPIATVLAVGEARIRWAGCDSFLITRAIPDILPLDECLAQRIPRMEPRVQSILRRRLAESLAQFCAAAHGAGVYHDDFHAGNLLVRTGWEVADHRPELFLIDVPGVRLTGSLGWRASRASLVMLRTSLDPYASRADLARFWRAYLAARPDLRISCVRGVVQEIERLAQSSARRILRRRDRRALRENADFLRLRNTSATVHAVHGLDANWLEQWMADPGRPLRDDRHAPVKLGHGSLIVKSSLSISSRRVSVAYKRIRARSRVHGLLNLARTGRALRCWKLGHALRARGIATPRPLAVCLPRGARGATLGYLATEWIEGAENVHLFLWRVAALPDAESRRLLDQLAESLGRLIGRMHFWRVAHRDLKASNLLVVQRETHLETYVLDLDGVRIRRRIAHRARVTDLARLAASITAHPWITHTARLGFLRHYLRALGGDSSDWKPLWRRTARRAAAKIQKQRRLGKPIA